MPGRNKVHYDFTVINHRYGVQAKRWRRVTVDGRPGKIVAAKGNLLLVMLDGDTQSVVCHPAWGVEYL